MKKEYVIGLITQVLDGYYFGSIIKSLSQYADEADKNIRIVVISTVSRIFNEIYALDYIDLWVTVLHSSELQLMKAIKKHEKPVIGINTFTDTDYTIRINNEGLIIQAIDHLKEHGHKQIGFVGSTEYRDGRSRFNAFKKYHDFYREDLFFSTHHDNIPVIAKKIAELDSDCRAFICGTDLIAAELINELKEYDIHIPEDIALISFDDIHAAQSHLHSLTTMHINFDDIGRHIVDAFLYYNEHLAFPSESITIEAYPVYRNSCGCEWEDQQIGLSNPIETIDYLSNMVSRNFVLGQRLQFYNTEELLKLNWLNHTPIRKGILVLKEGDILNTNRFETYDLATEKQTEQVFICELVSNHFPPKPLLFDTDFMENQNLFMVLSIIISHQYIGVFGFVGLADISTQLAPLHTTYHLANYFGAAFVRANIMEKMNNYSHQLEMISEIIYDGTWTYTRETDLIVCRGGIVQQFGATSHTAKFNFERATSLVHPDDRSLFLNEFASGDLTSKQIDFEVRMITTENEIAWIHIIGQLNYNDNQLISALGSIKDVTSRKKTEAKINELAYNDTLTGLANRASFDEHLTEELARAKRNDQQLAIILFNLDRFKVINDSYGHHTGDHILKAIAERIKPIIDENHFFARFGGDEFIICMSDISGREEVDLLANEVVSLINEPFYDQHRHYQLTTSVGISIYPDHSKQDEVLISADIAMHSAKSEGRNRIHIFNDQIKHYNAKQLKLEEHLRHAIENDELSLNFQPIYYVNSDEIYGLEALLRWNSREFGQVSPREFIPLAEETGLIVSIGEWVIYEAIRVMKKWTKMTDLPINMFINLSSRQISHPNFNKQLKRTFDITDIDPNRISFEITESMMIDNFERGQRILDDLTDMGVKLSLDDFGTGYSSLSTLRHLPFHILKIDKSFIDDLSSFDTNIAILKAIVEMAHSLKLLVVAEGIETKEQYELVAELGVDFIQGYYCNRPLPEEKIDAILESKDYSKSE